MIKPSMWDYLGQLVFIFHKCLQFHEITYPMLDDYPKHADENLKELKTPGSKKEIPSLILEAAFPSA